MRGDHLKVRFKSGTKITGSSKKPFDVDLFQLPPQLHRLRFLKSWHVIPHLHLLSLGIIPLYGQKLDLPIEALSCFRRVGGMREKRSGLILDEIFQLVYQILVREYERLKEQLAVFHGHQDGSYVILRVT